MFSLPPTARTTPRRRIVKRLLVALISGAAVFSIAFASAAALDVNGGTIQYGEDNQLTCTAGANVDGWGVETDTNLTSFVRINYNPACAGNDMFVKITQGGTVIRSVAKQPLDASGSTGNLAFTPVSTEAITDIHITIEGPSGEANN
jgi:hypothetical protein